MRVFFFLCDYIPKPMKPVKLYLDYREYLLDFYEEKRRLAKFFSYRYMAGRLGVDHTYVLRILNRKSHLANKHINQFASICGLRGSDAEYFRTLVRFNKAKDQDEAANFMEKLVSISGVKSVPIRIEQAEIFNAWHHLAVRALLGYSKLGGDYAKLASSLNPKIAEEQAKESVQLLEKLNLIRKSSAGEYALTDTLISTGIGLEPEPVRRFQKEMMKLGQESLDRFPKEQRDISTVTLSIKLSDLEAIRNKIFSFRQEIMSFAEKRHDTDAVFQLNVALFPLSQLAQ
jgi:uncharacterized protein (TIGR02147 family)